MTKCSLDDWIRGLFGLVAVSPSVCSIGIGALTILWRCLKWLQLAVWLPLTLRDGLVSWLGPDARIYILQTGHLGSDQILRWALDSSPLAPWLIVIRPVSSG
jgi:hypothetical protein